MTTTQRIRRIAKRLKSSFGDFAHHNKKDPLDELVFILLSLTTTEPVYLRTYAALKRAYPSYNQLLRAPVREVTNVIREGGQFNQKTEALKAILYILAQHFGKPTLAPLKNMSTPDCEAFLTTFPRVGRKVARCIMLYSLGRNVFPVDTHCWRVSSRMGLASEAELSSLDGVDVLQSKIPPRLRFSLHVNMVSLGRKFCKSKNPLCLECPVSSLCLKVGVN